MSAPTHPARRTDDLGNRLPWWSVALPAVAFAVLLVLMTGSGQAHAAAGPADASGLLHLVERILGALSL
jgi:type VI protein secretion system component VasF